MADTDNGMDLVIGLTVDSSTFEKDWEQKYRKEIQKKLDANPVSLKIDSKGIDELAKSIEKLQSLNTFTKPSSAAALLSSRIRAEAAANATALKANAKVTNDNAIAQERLLQMQAKTAAAQARSTKAINEQNKAWSTQRGLLNGLPQYLNQYISLLGATRFVQNIKDVTAEFELQRIALGAIIQDSEKANQLFRQTLSLAVESPFTAKQLITYTKQLSAYRIESEKLFDTTKMLADVSAGLGVSMDRLILAYGQVRAASVLRGTEVRQFTEAGIPLIDLLAKKFQELEGRVVSTSEVFDLISKRKVPFEYVAEIFQEMTSQGGMFFEMQKKQADTLYGVYQKLGDAMQISMASIGESNMGALRGAGELALVLAKNLQTILDVLLKGGVVWGTYTIAQRASMALMGSQNAAILKSIKTQKLHEASILRMTSVFRQLSAEEKNLIATSRTLTAADIKQITSNKQYTRDLGIRLVATKQITKALAEQHAAELQLTSAEITRLSSMNKWQTALGLLRGRIMSVVASLRAMTVAALSNPFTWIVGAISLITSFISKQRELKEALLEVSREYDNHKVQVDRITASYKRLEEQSKSATDSAAKATIYKDAFAELSQLATLYEDLVGQKGIIDLSVVNESNIYQFLDELQQKYNDAIKFTELLGYTTADMGKSLSKDVSKAGEAYGKFQSVLGDTESNFGRLALILKENYDSMSQYEQQLVDMFLQSKKEGQSEEDYLKNRIRLLEQMRYTAKESATGQRATIWDVSEKNVGLFGEMLSYVNKLIDANDELTRRSSKAQKTISDVIKDFKEANKGLDFENLSESKQYALEVAIRSKFSDEDWNDYARELAQKAARLELGVRVRFSPIIENKELEGWRKDFAKVLGNEITAETTYQKGKKSLIDAYKQEAEVYSDLLNRRKAGNKVSQEEINSSNQRLSSIKQLASAYGILLESSTKATKSASDQIMAEVEVIKEAYQQYQKFLKVASKTDAFKKVNDAFSELFDNFKYLKGAVTPTSASQINAFLQQAIDTGKLDQNVKIKVGAEIADNTIDELTKNLKDSLKKAQDDIANTKVATEFYNSLMSSGFGEPVAWQMTMNIYGVNPQDIRDQMQRNLQEAFKEKLGIDMPLDINAAQAAITSANAGTEVKEYLNALLQSLRDYDVATINSLKETLSKYSEFESKRTQILRNGIAERKKIEESAIPETEKARLREASETRQKVELDQLTYDDFKNSDIYIKMFEDLDKVSQSMLTKMREKLIEVQSSLKGLDPQQLKEIQSRLSEIDSELIQRNPFKALGVSLNEYLSNLGKVRDAEKAYMQASEDYESNKQTLQYYEEQKLTIENLIAEKRKSVDASDAEVGQLENQLSALDTIIDAQREITRESEQQVEEAGKLVSQYRRVKQQLRESLGETAEIFGSAADTFAGLNQVMSDFGVNLDTSQLAATFSDLESVFGGVEGVLDGVMSLNPGKIISGLGGVFSGIVGVFTGLNRRVARANKEIERQHDIVYQLEQSYKQLERSVDNALGSDYLAGVQDMERNLKAQAEAYQKMYQAEMSKRKKRDEEKMREYQEKYQENLEAIEDLHQDMMTKIMGQSQTTAAEQFAQSWLDAYASFEDTSLAITEDFQDMMKNIIINAALSKIAQKYIGQLYDYMDKAAEDQVISQSEIAGAAELIESLGNNMNAELLAYMEALKQAGFNIQQGESTLTGISAAASNITEDTALTLGAIGNNLVYYVVAIHDMLAKKYAIEGTTGEGNAPTLLSVQQAALNEIRAIQNNTLRNAIAAEQLVSALSSVTAPLGVRSGAKAINVNIS